MQRNEDVNTETTSATQSNVLCCAYSTYARVHYDVCNAMHNHHSVSSSNEDAERCYSLEESEKIISPLA